MNVKGGAMTSARDKMVLLVDDEPGVVSHDPFVYEKFLTGRRIAPAPDGFFPKPIEPDKFLAAIDELLAREVHHAHHG